MSKELEVAIKAAKEAGKILQKHFRKSNKITIKEDMSLLTEADKLAEEKIIFIIKNYFPDYSINAEESGFSKKTSDYLWMIDPLDATTNFSIGVPIFAVSIALALKKELLLGVTYNPFTQELFWAEKGKGAFLNGKKVCVSETSELRKSLVFFNRGRAREDAGNLAKAFDKISHVIRTPRIFGSSTYQFALVASGRASGIISFGCTYWDVGAGVLLVKEAGGSVTDLKGDEWTLDSKDILASNGKIHDELLKILNS